MSMCENNRNKNNGYNNNISEKQSRKSEKSVADKILDILSVTPKYEDVSFLVSADEMTDMLPSMIEFATNNGIKIASVFYDNEYDGGYLMSYIDDELFIERKVSEDGEYLLSDSMTLYVSSFYLSEVLNIQYKNANIIKL